MIAGTPYSLVNRFNKLIRAADAIERGETPQEQQDKRAAKEVERPLMKRFTLYSKILGKEKPIAFGLYAGDLELHTLLAQKRLLKISEPNIDGKTLYELTTFESREEG